MMTLARRSGGPAPRATLLQPRRDVLAPGDHAAPSRAARDLPAADRPAAGERPCHAAHVRTMGARLVEGLRRAEPPGIVEIRAGLMIGVESTASRAPHRRAARSTL